MSATCSLETASQHEWDALVIGAGLAGSLAAQRLAQSGLKTLLVDQKLFPRSKVCGCCLNARALQFLHAAGLADELMAAGMRASHAFHLRTKGKELRMPIGGGGAVLSRSRLDQLLVQSAVASGADFLPGVTATVLPTLLHADSQCVPHPASNGPGDGPVVRRVQLQRSGHSRATLESGSGVPPSTVPSSTIVSTHVVVVADGLGGGSLHLFPELRSEAEENSRLGGGAIVSGNAAACASLEPGVIEMAVGRGGYVGAVSLEEGSVNFAAAFDASSVRAHHGLAGAAAAILAETSSPLSELAPTADWIGTPALSRQRPCFAERLFVVGDACGYVEPFTGEGMTWALEDAWTASPMIANAVKNRNAAMENEWGRRHANLVRKRQRWCRTIARLLRSPQIVRLGMGLVDCFPLVGRMLASRLDRTETTARPSAEPSAVHSIRELETRL